MSDPSPAPAGTSSPSRRPYTGSCHCGRIKYVVRLALPLTLPDISTLPGGADFVCRCNCTPCHKMGLMHLRLVDAPDNFAIILPPKSESESKSGAASGAGGKGHKEEEEDALASLVQDYKCNAGRIHWYFCPTCGVHCFGIDNEKTKPKIVEEEGEGWGPAEKQRTWRLGKEGWCEGREDGAYLSVNAMTLDAGQEGLDIAAWQEDKLVLYVNWLNREAVSDVADILRFGKPFEGGAY